MKSNPGPGGRCRAVLWLSTGCLGLLLVTGCAGEGKEKETEVEEKDETLTAEAAKKALLEMDRSQIPRGDLIKRPKDEPITSISTDEMALGAWTFNLKEKTFHATFEYPDAPRHKLNEAWGVFERTVDGKWVAKVTGSQSAG